MGQEAQCRAEWNGQSSVGKALLETDYVLFRGDFRVKAEFKQMKKVSAGPGVLIMAMPDGTLTLNLGAAAAKWADKINNPPSLLDKLGVKSGSRVALIGKFPERFEAELWTRAAKGVAGCDAVLLLCETRDALTGIERARGKLTEAGGLWIVYPKGLKTITELDVLGAGRAAGLKDNKVASFSTTHTALRFVIPVADRGTASPAPRSRKTAAGAGGRRDPK